jgi:hypothetical protein
MDKRGRGRPHYSRPGGQRYIHAFTNHAVTVLDGQLVTRRITPA